MSALLRCLVLLFALGGGAVLQATAQPPALQFSRTVNVPLGRAQVTGLVRDAWANSFGLDQGARLSPVDGSPGAFTGVAHFAFRPQQLIGREEASGTIHYQVTVQAENGSCLVRVTGVVHKGNSAAKRDAIDLGVLRETEPEDLRVPGLSRTSGIELYREARNAAEIRIEQLLGRFESTLRDRATP
jgi:hypothetical protein